MSVDPDDVTRRGVALAGAEDIIYGTAVLPGAMLMVARIGDVPVIGTPACALYHPRTMFDLVLPKILAGERISRRDLAAMGHGGMCLNCQTCKYPVCPFGKGSNL
jgi:molybdopterin biosynthesis enzyme